MSDRITIEIDDAALDAAIAKFDAAASASPGASPVAAASGRGVGRGGVNSATRRAMAELYYSELFGINTAYPFAKRAFNPVAGMPANFAKFMELNDEMLKNPRILDALRNLPTLDRNWRVLIGQIPGGRAASQTLFRARWVGKMMDDYPVETAAILASTAIMAAKSFDRFTGGVKRDRQQYKEMITDFQPTVTREYLDKWVSEREDWWRRWIVG